ncbi:MAG TPA: HD domain-containing protein [Candidatus Thermoplasmatota archaeon]|nr:HD domain-containing protein [Candidatus Thermoplasmatota archaeon]
MAPPLPITVRDPIHGSIRIDDWALPLVDSAVVQRLRRIHQLGTAHLVYPGAHHRRFEHSLGAHHLAGRFAKALGLGEWEANTVRAAALLHDVGHGPFSHAFEELVKEEGRRHEQASMDLVGWGPLADPLRQAGLDPLAVAECIGGKGPLAPIVSGSLDADRLDYLLRDAHYTGVRTAVDADRLIEVLRAGDSPDGPAVVLDESGLIAAEAILTTRFLMYPAVYLHHTVRSSESMLQAAVRGHIEATGVRLHELERETDDGLLQRLRAGGGGPAALVARLEDRRLFKRAYEGRPDQPNTAALLRLSDRPRERRRLAAEIAQDAGVDEGLVLLDVPHPPKFREMRLQVRQRDGDLVPLPVASRLVKVLEEARMDHWRAWVFTPKADRERVGASAARTLDTLA